MTNSETADGEPLGTELTTMDLVFVGFNSRVLALDRETGEVIWDWKSPKGRSPFVSILLDGPKLMVCVHGYMYCLDPLTGQLLWKNPLKGYGMGIPSLVSLRGNSGSSGAAAIIAQQQAAAGGVAGAG
ncbi:MAG: PQQ-binding-like beta-propeller repeat protein [Planctomycetes bacterium]|nr:PQQ-binding-like beta-propeller repeat protein [Planctomycetota bacterium]